MGRVLAWERREGLYTLVQFRYRSERSSRASDPDTIRFVVGTMKRDTAHQSPHQVLRLTTKDVRGKMSLSGGTSCSISQSPENTSSGPCRKGLTVGDS